MKKVIESNNVHRDEIVINEEILSDGSEVYEVQVHNHGGRGVTIMALNEGQARRIFKVLEDSVGINVW